MYLAYQMLSETMKRVVDGLVCLHRGETGDGYAVNRSMKIKAPDAIESEHPLVRTHPETGQKCLMLHRQFIKGIKGMSDAESAAILDFLHEHAENPDFAVRFRWEVGSVALWDNRCTQHRVTGDYKFSRERSFAPQRRVMHRVAINGDRPQ
jgi:taurine dioxygenase